MKKIKILKDKKFNIYVVIIAILVQLYMGFIILNVSDTYYNSLNNIMPMNVLAITLLIMLLIISKTKITFWIDDSTFRVGEFFPKKIYYTNILQIEIIKNQFMVIKEKTRITKIKIFDIEKNYNEYLDLLNCIDEKNGNTNRFK